MSVSTRPADEPIVSALVAAGARHPILQLAFLLLKWTLVAMALWYFLRLLDRVDWSTVWDTFRQLGPWQVLALLGIVGARSLVASTPLAMFVPGLRLGRAVMNDLAGNMTATITPPPADIVIRSAMFHSWNIDVSRGLAGLVLNTVFFFISRFAAPILGFLLWWALFEYDATFAWTALVSGLGAAGLAVGLAVSMRSGPAAAAAGRWAGRTLTRLRPTWPGPTVLEPRFVEFWRTTSGVLRRRWPQAGVAAIAQPVVESMLLVASVRFVGVSAADAPATLLVAAFLVAYPMTALPLLGLGVLDAAIVSLIADRSAADTDGLVAALVVWRVFFQLVPLLLGAATVGLWRLQVRRTAAPTPL